MFSFVRSVSSLHEHSVWNEDNNGKRWMWCHTVNRSCNQYTNLFSTICNNRYRNRACRERRNPFQPWHVCIWALADITGWPIGSFYLSIQTKSHSKCNLSFAWPVAANILICTIAHSLSTRFMKIYSFVATPCLWLMCAIDIKNAET